jgi:hypothetical protein
MKDVQLPYARREDDGRMVTIGDALKGLACGCVCPACAGKVIAVKGEVYQHHFRHRADAVDACRSALETGLHQIAKQIIADALRLTLPGKADLGPMRSATIEAAVSELRIDVLAKYDTETVAIEVYVAHKVPVEKVSRLAELEQTAIEINLSNHLYVTMEDSKLRWVVLHDAPRHWLVPPRAVREERAARAAELAEIARKARERAEAARAEEEYAKQEKAAQAIQDQAAYCARVAEVEARQAEEQRYRASADAHRAEALRAVTAQFRHNRQPPDLQLLVEAHGGFDKIPEQAWRRYHYTMKEWRLRLINGEL